MSKENNVIQFYVLCNKLKHTIRTGWKNWNVKADRLESVAEHIYGVQMLSLAMYSEFQYDIDIKKVIFMLAIHELGETIIGDLTLFDISSKEKAKIEHEAVSKILDGLLDGQEILELFLEFEKKESKEALFAFQCDKLECDLQCKLYDEDNLVDFNEKLDNNIMKDERIRALSINEKKWSSMWLKFSLNSYPYDENFQAIANYALKHKISKQ